MSSTFQTAFHPALLAVTAAQSVAPDGLTLALPLAPAGHGPDRHSVFLTAGDAHVEWYVPSLASLCRGTRTPPDLKTYPAAYVPGFFGIELHSTFLLKTGMGVTDDRFAQIYGNLGKKFDGPSLGPDHDAVWQSVAFTLARFVYSKAEIQAILARLATSARFYKQGPTSRFYAERLVSTFGSR